MPITKRLPSFLRPNFQTTRATRTCSHVAGALVLAAGLCACGHEVESPEIQFKADDAVVPDLVCNAQLVTDVVIEGEGFRPAPTDTLAEPT